MGKWRDFLFYKRTIDKHKAVLFKKHGLRCDSVYRLYKTYKLTKEDITKYTNYGGDYVDIIVKKEITKIDETIIDLKLYDLIGLYELKPFRETSSIGMTFGFKPFNTAKRASRIIWATALVTLTTIGGLTLSYGGIILGFIMWLASLLSVNYFGVFKN